MEHFALQILMTKEGRNYVSAARELSAKYDEVLVDEYQDSNQCRRASDNSSIRASTRRKYIHGRDVKQSIYRFCLARLSFSWKNIKDLTEEAQEQRIDLHKNSRSREQVLRV